MRIELYSNLLKVRPALWLTLERFGVELATSYYSRDTAVHDGITGRPRSHDLTRANIEQAVGRGIPVRVGVIVTRPGQDVQDAKAELEGLGVTDVTVDSMRPVGRGAAGAPPDVAGLCGSCARGSLAVTPSGETFPCVFSRWLRVGNVRSDPVAAVHAAAGPTRAWLAGQFADRAVAACVPDDAGCRPSPCRPIVR